MLQMMNIEAQKTLEKMSAMVMGTFNK
jgi:hypothetical protein